MVDESKIPFLRFKNDVQFQQALTSAEYDIHMRTFNAIKEALDTNNTEEIIIAYLDDYDTTLGCTRDNWYDNLEASLKYFIKIEEYENCAKINQLLARLIE